MTAQYITGYWGHIFKGERSERMTKIFAHADTGKIITAKIERHRGLAGDLGYGLATRDEAADIEDSLINANGDALDNPEQWGLELTDTEPDWVTD